MTPQREIDLTAERAPAGLGTPNPSTGGDPSPPRRIWVGRIPIVEHMRADPSPAETSRAMAMAERWLAELPRLSPRDSSLLALAPARIDDGGPTLHVDDFSGTPLLSRFYDVSFLQHRARLRAGDDDLVVTSLRPEDGYEEYCRDRLGLGSVTWLVPAARRDPLQLALACYEDRAVRKDLVGAMRRAELAWVHPHMGNFPAWALATLLRRSARRPLGMIAPPPGVTRFVNNKIYFAEAVSRLFGRQALPRTHEAPNFVTLARYVQHLAARHRVLAFKVPDSAGGAGNLILEAERFQGLTLGEIRRLLKELMVDLAWMGEGSLLVSHWETDVLGAPSAQLWIPPEAAGPPIVEALYLQIVEGDRGYFAGGQPARLPEDLAQAVTDRCWLIARMFQRMRYVGRCSIDLLLVGKSLADCGFELIECNGRWGGTSLPMTLANRVFGDACATPHAFRELRLPGLRDLGFQGLLELLDEDLFDRRTGRGHLVLYNPGRVRVASGINVLALAPTWEEAATLVGRAFPKRLRAALRERGLGPDEPAG